MTFSICKWFKEIGWIEWQWCCKHFNSYAPFSLKCYTQRRIFFSCPFFQAETCLRIFPYVRFVLHACFQLFIFLSGAWFTCECLALTDASSATNYQPSHHLSCRKRVLRPSFDRPLTFSFSQDITFLSRLITRDWSAFR